MGEKYLSFNTHANAVFLLLFTYLAVLIHLVVGELDLLEGDDLLPQLLPGVRGVWVWVEAARWGRVCLASDQPGGAVVGVAVALIVAGHNVQDDMVFEVWVQVDEAGPDSGEHPPVAKWKDRNMNTYRRANSRLCQQENFFARNDESYH